MKRTILIGSMVLLLLALSAQSHMQYSFMRFDADTDGF